MPLDVNEVRRDFPIFNSEPRNGQRLVYLDSAATSHKPQSVIDAMSDFYSHDYGTVRRGIYHLSARATELYEQARQNIADFINASPQELIFTRGATESINLAAKSWGETFVGEADEIILSEFEHHSNLVPWLMLKEKVGANLVFVRSSSDWQFDLDDFRRKLSPRTRLVALTGMSNVLGCLPDLETVTELAHNAGAKVLVDGAQLVPHYGFDVRKIDCDFLAFSAHKMLGPTGIGALYIKREIAEEMPPFLGGGDMIETVEYDHFSTNELPYKFEAGTPNIAGVIGFAESVRYLESLGKKRITEHENQLTEYALEKLLSTDGLTLYGPASPERRGSVFAFNYKDVHAHDLATILDFSNVAVRAGHHCAQPLMKKLGVAATARASLYVYNDEEDIDLLLDSLKGSERLLKNAVR